LRPAQNIPTTAPMPTRPCSLIRTAATGLTAAVMATLPATWAAPTAVIMDASDDGASAASSPPKMVLGYYTNWAQYRPQGGTFVPEDINPAHFTHICYAFARVTLDYLVEPFEWNDVNEWNPDEGMYRRFHAHIRAGNPAAKTLISLGGWNFGSTIFSPMVRSTESRRTFVKSAVAFARAHGFDGLDLDWEYPSAADRDNYGMLVKELRAAVDQEAAESGRAALLLSLAVPAGETNIETGFDVPLLAGLVDWFGVMTYDLHGSWDRTTGMHTALYSAIDGDQLTASHALKAWESRGAPAAKLLMGLATYGRGWTLMDPTKNGIRAPARGASDAGRYTREMGFLAWYEIQAMLNATGSKPTFDYETEVMYTTKGDQWVGFDNPTTLKIKTEYIKDHGYAGAMIWAIDLDDFHAGYPLISAVARGLK